MTRTRHATRKTQVEVAETPTRKQKKPTAKELRIQTAVREKIAPPAEPLQPIQPSKVALAKKELPAQTTVIEKIQLPAKPIEPVQGTKIERVISESNPVNISEKSCFQRFLEEVREILSSFSSKKKPLDILQAPQSKTRATFTCDGIDDDGLIAFLQKFPDVQNISMYECPNVSERGLLSLKNFYDIYFMNMPITDAGVHILAAQSPQLESLSLHNCKDITTNAVHALQYLPKLKEISFEECSVHDEALDAIVRYCPKIQRIHVRFSYVSFLKMKEFQRKFPQIQLIW